MERSNLALAAAGCASLCEDCRVRGISVCRAIATDQIESLARLATRMRVDAGKLLFAEGDPAEHMFSLGDGMVKLFKMLPDGRRQIVGFLLAGDFLGLAFLNTYAYTAEAVTEVALCRFSRRRFLHLIEEQPALEKELLGRASSELAAAQEQMLLLGRKSARERVASFLLDLDRRHRAAGLTTVPLPMSRSDVADYLGLTVETVSRAIQAARGEGLIRIVDRHHYVVLDRPRLAQSAAAT